MTKATVSRISVDNATTVEEAAAAERELILRDMRRHFLSSFRLPIEIRYYGELRKIIESREK